MATCRICSLHQVIIMKMCILFYFEEQTLPPQVQLQNSVAQFDNHCLNSYTHFLF